MELLCHVKRSPKGCRLKPHQITTPDILEDTTVKWRELGLISAVVFLSLASTSKGFDVNDPLGLQPRVDDMQRTVDGIVKEWDKTVKTLQTVTYDAVPGAPWAKLLRMAHEGTDEEKEQATKIIQSYFGLKVANQYTARIWIEYSGLTPLEFDFFGAPTLGEQEAFKYASSFAWNQLNVGPNSGALLTNEQKKEKFVKAYADILSTNDGAGCQMIGVGPATTGPYGIRISASYVPEPTCLRKNIEAKAGRIRDVISDYVTTSLAPTGASNWDFPWDPTQPFLWVALRKDQFDTFMNEANDKKAKGLQPPKLLIKIALTDPTDPSKTYGNKPPATIESSDFQGEYPVTGKDFKIVAAKHNFTNIRYNGPEDIKLQEQIAALWESFLKSHNTRN
jgi:hypothetical protein